jgi:hypothetical protein
VVGYEGPGRVPARPTRDFYAKSELVELESKLSERGDHAMVVLQGMGGVGKTTLAREFVARRAAEYFAAGAAWLDARDLERDLPRVAQRFGYPIARDPTPAEAKEFLERTLYERKALLVLDGLHQDQADPSFVPVPGGACRG